jgi:hypothetical protein
VNSSVSVDFINLLTWRTSLFIFKQESYRPSTEEEQRTSSWTEEEERTSCWTEALPISGKHAV